MKSSEKLNFVSNCNCKKKIKDKQFSKKFISVMYHKDENSRNTDPPDRISKIKTQRLSD